MHRKLRTRSASSESSAPPPPRVKGMLAAITVGALIIFSGPTLAAADELATPPVAGDEAAAPAEATAAEPEAPPAEPAPPAEEAAPPAEEAAPPAEEAAPPAEEAAPPAEGAPPAEDAAVPDEQEAAPPDPAAEPPAPAPVDCMAIPIGNDDRSARDACLAEQQAGLRSFAAAASPDPAPNPDLPDSCGLDFALVLDKSGSIGDDGIADLKDAADAFTEALKDTGSEVSVTAFDQDASLLQSAIALTSANLATIQGSYGGLASDGWTNWKRGLEVGLGSFGGFSDQPVELTIVITDGNPNTVDPDNGGEFPDGSPGALDPAILQADAIKGTPSHVFVVAVGENVSLGPIQSISGGTEFDGSNIATADYMTSTDYASLADDLQLVAEALCGGNVIIHKQVGAAFPGVAGGAGWEFSTATSDVDPTSDTTDASSQTDPYEVTGFAVQPDPPARQVAFSETANGGSMLTGARCGPSPEFEDAVDVPFDTDTRTFTATVEKEETTHCWVLNTFAPRWLAWKTVNPTDGSTVEPGEDVTYTLHAENDGVVPVTGAVLVDDLSDVLDDATVQLPLPAGAELVGDTLTWSIPDLGPGESATLSFTVTVDDDAFGEVLANVVTPGDNGRCSDDVKAATSVDDCTTHNPTPDIAIDKEVVRTDLDVATGEWTLGYTLDVENTGDVDTEYTLSDATDFGDGMSISAIEYWMPGEDPDTDPGHALVGPFDPVGEYLLGADVPIAVGVTDSWFVRVTATVDDDGMPEYGCEGEDGGGFSNTGIVTIGTGVRWDEACDAPGRLTLIKSVDNEEVQDIPDFPLAVPSDWLLKAEGPVTVEDPGADEPGTSYLVPTGWYDLSERPNPDSDNPYIDDGTYVPGEWVCDDGGGNEELQKAESDGEVFVPADGEATCRIVNTADPADLGIVKEYELPEGVEAIDDTDPEASEFWFTLTVTNHGPDVPGALVTDTLPDTLEVISGIEIDPVDPNWTASFTGNEFSAEYSGVVAAGSVTEFRFQVRFLGEPVGPLPENPEVPPEPVPAEPVVNEACVAIPEPEPPAEVAALAEPPLPVTDLNPGNDCDDTTVPTKAMQANAYVQCINDVPWLFHNVMTSGPVTPSDITVTWTPDPVFYPDAVPVVTVIPWEERNGRVIWPYGEVNDEGISIAWPGWRLAEPGDVVGEGTIVDSWENMVKDSSLPSYAFADQLHPMTITFEINPSQSVLAVYPQATPACAVTREAGPLIGKTSSVTTAKPGDTFDYTLSVTNPGLGATKAMELFDEIPADLEVNSITTPPAPAFPRWDDCEVTGKDSSGYGGTLHCILNGQIGGTRPDAPDVVLSVTLDPTSTASSIVNTGEICWNDLPDDQTAAAAEGAIPLDPAEPILCDDSSVTVTVPQPGSSIASTGFAGSPFIWVAAGMLLVGGIAVTFAVLRRRRTGEA